MPLNAGSVALGGWARTGRVVVVVVGWVDVVDDDDDEVVDETRAGAGLAPEESALFNANATPVPPTTVIHVTRTMTNHVRCEWCFAARRS